jgi:UDP:flavonoid glycosyltransferase YjiC (YdhE family)
MKFVLASYGSRGDIEPCAAAGLELQRRGHELCIAVPPNLVGFIESAGLPAVAYGPDSRAALNTDHLQNFWEDFPGNFLKLQNPLKLVRETVVPLAAEPFEKDWVEMSSTLASLADGADLIMSGQSFPEAAANVAEYYNIPLATLHYYPVRVNGQLISALPSPLVRSALSLFEWVQWRCSKKVEDAQRRDLGLPKATASLPRRIAERGSLEIQAYDELFFPGLAAEWAKWGGRRPFVGALAMEQTTDTDEELMSWIAAGKPPIYFGFGSTPVESPDATVDMIAAACAELGERALIYSGEKELTRISPPDHVKLVGVLNFATVFPACRAVVHHGGAGTTTAGLRAGLPMLILWTWADQPLWATQVKRLKLGLGRRFSEATQESLVSDLRAILKPQYAARAREVAPRITKPAVGNAAAADFLENFASLGRIG